MTYYCEVLQFFKRRNLPRLLFSGKTVRNGEGRIFQSHPRRCGIGWPAALFKRSLNMVFVMISNDALFQTSTYSELPEPLTGNAYSQLRSRDRVFNVTLMTRWRNWLSHWLPCFTKEARAAVSLLMPTTNCTHESNLFLRNQNAYQFFRYLVQTQTLDPTRTLRVSCVDTAWSKFTDDFSRLDFGYFIPLNTVTGIRSNHGSPQWPKIHGTPPPRDSREANVFAKTHDCERDVKRNWLLFFFGCWSLFLLVAYNTLLQFSAVPQRLFTFASITSVPLGLNYFVIRDSALLRTKIMQTNDQWYLLKMGHCDWTSRIRVNLQITLRLIRRFASTEIILLCIMKPTYHSTTLGLRVFLLPNISLRKCLHLLFLI